VLVVLETFSRSSADPELRLRLRLKVRLRLRMRRKKMDFFMAWAPFRLKYREGKIYQELPMKSSK
jgi:hypothetical protein